MLEKLLIQQTSSSTSSIIGTGTTAIRGDIHVFFLAKSDFSQYWIVDSGASDHMTSNFKMFSFTARFQYPNQYVLLMGRALLYLARAL